MIFNRLHHRLHSALLNIVFGYLGTSIIQYIRWSLFLERIETEWSASCLVLMPVLLWCNHLINISSIPFTCPVLPCHLLLLIHVLLAASSPLLLSPLTHPKHWKWLVFLYSEMSSNYAILALIFTHSKWHSAGSSHFGVSTGDAKYAKCMREKRDRNIH